MVDGYNLIRQSMAWGPVFDSDPETARGDLIDILGSYRKNRGHEVTVAFDGMDSYHLSPEEHRQAGVKVIFSARHQSADDLIAELAARLGPGTVVVTSDRGLGDRCLAHGAEVMPSAEFEAHLMGVLLGGGAEPESEDVEPSLSTRKKGPSRRLKKRDRRRRSRLSKL